MLFLTSRGFAFLVVGCFVICLSQGPSAAQTGTMPDFARIGDITTSSPQPGVTKLTITTLGPIPSGDQSKLTFEAYFSSLGPDYPSDTAVLFSHGSYTYPSDPAIAPGTAGVVDIPGGFAFGDADVVVDGSTITITFASVFVNDMLPNYVVTRFLPADSAESDLTPYLADCFIVSSDYLSRSTIPPAHPSRANNPPTYPRLIIYRGFEFNSPPKWGERGNQVADINGDGNPDWQYPVNHTIPGTEVTIGLFGAGGCFYLGVGIDQDGDDHLDTNEITGYIGMCQYIIGGNGGAIGVNQNGQWTIVWENYGYYLFGIEKERTRYEYIVATDTLTVLVSTDGGNTYTQTFSGKPTKYPKFTSLVTSGTTQ